MFPKYNRFYTFKFVQYLNWAEYWKNYPSRVLFYSCNEGVVAGDDFPHFPSIHKTQVIQGGDRRKESSEYGESGLRSLFPQGDSVLSFSLSYLPSSRL